MELTQQIRKEVSKAILTVYNKTIPEDELQVNETKAEFDGQYTLVTFSLAKTIGGRPDEIAEKIGQCLTDQSPQITDYNVIKGFLNLSLADGDCIRFLKEAFKSASYGQAPSVEEKIMVEYSSPNTNKPLHFGHLRNNFLGYAVSEIWKAYGRKVVKANLVNDRGIHICKSMLAWKEYANGETPESSGIKGDHLVGKYYVKFNSVYKEQIKDLVDGGMETKVAEREAAIFKEAQEMLRQWEAGDEETVALWKKMNAWVYAGFDKTYERLGIDFDRVYYESEVYLSGKEKVQQGLKDGIFFQKEDNSIWVDLESDGMDQKILLRSDGTSVYMTQDIGTAELKYADEKMDRSVYVVGDEQNYHFKVLKLVMQKMGRAYADGMYHLSYGMVELPSGKMKSREGTVVDADDMIDEMLQIAEEQTNALGKVDGYSAEELEKLYNTIGLGALKFYLLRVDPKKKMIFNPEESIDFHGFTGPFVQYTHARLCSILRKSDTDLSQNQEEEALHLDEKEMIVKLEKFPKVIEEAALNFSPSIICNYAFNLAKAMNSFLSAHSILQAESEAKKVLRLQLAQFTANTLSKSLELLGIDAPERM